MIQICWVIHCCSYFSQTLSMVINELLELNVCVFNINHFDGIITFLHALNWYLNIVWLAKKNLVSSNWMADISIHFFLQCLLYLVFIVFPLSYTESWDFRCVFTLFAEKVSKNELRFVCDIPSLGAHFVIGWTMFWWCTLSVTVIAATAAWNEK